MVKFRNLARDINANPLQFRVWITDEPDTDGYYYTGPKSGDNDLQDFSHYLVANDEFIVDFNQILGDQWEKTSEVLPTTSEASSLAIIDGYVYLFGGNLHDKILRAPTADPARFVDTGATLPDNLYGSHCFTNDGYVYLIGGSNGQSVKNIYSAPLSNPLNWTDQGELLPEARSFGTLLFNDGYVYLVGGFGDNIAEATIFQSTLSDPTIWINTVYTLPEPLYGSQATILDNGFYLFGGNDINNEQSETIYYSDTDSISFTNVGDLPYKVSNGQLCAVGNDLFYYTPTSTIPDGYGDGYTSQTRILYASKDDLLTWSDTEMTLPGEVSLSQIAIVYDRLFLYGGSGSTVILTSSPKYKFSFLDESVIDYGQMTRTDFQAETSISEQYRVLGFPPWKTNY